jgi:hypothetical protein
MVLSELMGYCCGCVQREGDRDGALWNHALFVWVGPERERLLWDQTERECVLCPENDMERKSFVFQQLFLRAHAIALFTPVVCQLWQQQQAHHHYSLLLLLLLFVVGKSALSLLWWLLHTVYLCALLLSTLLLQ